MIVLQTLRSLVEVAALLSQSVLDLDHLSSANAASVEHGQPVLSANTGLYCYARSRAIDVHRALWAQRGILHAHVKPLWYLPGTNSSRAGRVGDITGICVQEQTGAIMASILDMPELPSDDEEDQDYDPKRQGEWATI